MASAKTFGDNSVTPKQPGRKYQIQPSCKLFKNLFEHWPFIFNHEWLRIGFGDLRQSIRGLCVGMTVEKITSAFI